MTCRFAIDGKVITYTLKRSARRSIGFKVDHHGLTVAAPERASLSYIEQALAAKARWILKALDKVQADRLDTLAPIIWQDGTIFPFLGKDCSLHLVKTLSSRNRFIQTDGELILQTTRADAESVTKTMRNWLKAQAKTILLSRLADQADTMQLTYDKAALSNATRRWGSCTAKRHIRLNWRLVLTDWSLMDYVIVHELAHLTELNHSPRFWAIVEEWYPDWRQARQKLNALGPRLFTLFPE
ncbi:MAG: M48 family metallopeptidase [Oxalobacter sp.]|nr:M48 family metallopeptidase [Oxalobacter sp.]